MFCQISPCKLLLGCEKKYLQPVLSYNLNKTKQVVIIFLNECLHAIYQHLQLLKLSFVKQTKIKIVFTP